MVGKGFQLFRILGIDVRVDWSWLLILALVTWNLSRVFGQIHPGWSPTLQWGISLTAALTFFASVLVHELAHELLHCDPANRPKEKKVREAEAEAVAYVVCQGIGLDVNTASSDYIQLYDGDKKTLIASLERIQKTAGEILEAVTDDGPCVEAAGRQAGVAVAA